MKKVLIAAGLGAFVLIAAAGAFLHTPDTNPEEMHAKYGGAASLYAEAAGGMKVHYRVSGPEGAPVLVLIHGTSASLHTWEPLTEALPDSYRVIAYDQPGHGLTGPHPERDYSYQGMADGLDAVFEAEGIEKAVLIGNSMGGWIAWRDALANPERVRALVLIDASGIPETINPASAEGFRAMQSPVRRKTLQFVTPRSRVEQTVRDTVAVDEIVTKEMVDRYWELLRYPGNRQALADQFVTRREDLSGRLGEIEQPTLILWGAEDRLVLPSGAAAFAERMPNARSIVYEGVGHLPMEEVPGRVASDIEAFLSQLPPEPLEQPAALGDMDG